MGPLAGFVGEIIMSIYDNINVRNPSEFFRQVTEREEQLQAMADSRNKLDKTYRVMYKPNIDSEWTLGVDCGSDYEAARALRQKWLRGKYCFDVCIERSNKKSQSS